MRFIFFVLDESMSRLCPKTSKLGGLPNCAHEPRKPVPLGAIIKKLVEYNTDVIFCNDIVKNP